MRLEFNFINSPYFKIYNIFIFGFIKSKAMKYLNLINFFILHSVVHFTVRSMRVISTCII